MNRFLIPAVAALSLVGATAQAATCADRTHVVTQLEQRYGETLYANAVSPSNKILEVYASPDGRTWSILVHLPERDLSCLAATGKGMTQLTAALDLQ